MKKIILGLVFALTSTAAFAACTQEEYTAKATELSTKTQQVMMKDPASAQKWQARMMEVAQAEAAKGNGNDINAACDMMDKLIKELESAL